jgi:NADPH:quinone reductase-like Zn-dependent oxidoreductase
VGAWAARCRPAVGDVLVNGASGSVGSFVVALLSKLGIG